MNSMWANAQRFNSPADSTVYIRVVGSIELERVDSLGRHSIAERDIEFSTGSGFLFTPYGHVLTNYHIIDEKNVLKRLDTLNSNARVVTSRVEVVLPHYVLGGELVRFEAHIDVANPELDLAILSIPGGDLPYLGLGDSSAMQRGAKVRVYGFPFGGMIELGIMQNAGIEPTVSMTTGIVTASRIDESGKTAFLQTNASINPGNSGGPMVDSEGYVQGIVQLKLSEGEGIGFSIPINIVKNFLDINGFIQLLPVQRLQSGVVQALPSKGLKIALPGAIEDVSPVRTQAYNTPEQGHVQFVSERVFTTFEVTKLENILRSGNVFSQFMAVGEKQSSTSSEGKISGFASGHNVDSVMPRKMEYVILGDSPEFVIARFEASADHVAYNRSILRNALDTIQIESLLSNPVRRQFSVPETGWRVLMFPVISNPVIVLPNGWNEDGGGPIRCDGLPLPTAGVASSPPGDFTVALRAAWLDEVMDPKIAALACGDNSGEHDGTAYRTQLAWLGINYIVEGVFVPRSGGILQLELIAPEEKHSFMEDLYNGWVEANIYQ